MKEDFFKTIQIAAGLDVVPSAPDLAPPYPAGDPSSVALTLDTKLFTTSGLYVG